MQSPNIDNQRPSTCDTDGRRDTEQLANQDEARVAGSEVSDMANRTVCLNANISGSGGAAA